MKRWLYGALFLLFALPTFAASAGQVPSDFSQYKIPATDASMQYLGQLFGTVSNVLTGGGSSLLGQLFLVLNTGIMIVAGVWLVYTIFNVFLTAALEGGFNAPNKKTALIFIRLALGFALLVPNPNTGYSGVQDIVMKVTVAGIQLADDTWAFALQYLKNGGMLYPEGGTLSIASQVGSVTSDFLKSSGPVSAVFNSEVCMDLGNSYNRNNPNDPLSKASSDIPYAMHQDPRTGVISFPGYGDTPPYTSASLKCGMATPYAATTVYGQNLSSSALSQLALDLEPAAQQEASLVADPEHYDATVVNTQIASGIYNAVFSYLGTIRPVLAKTSDGKTPTFFTTAKKEGWFTAGRFYWDLAQYNDSLTNKTSFGSSVPKIISYDSSDFPKNLIQNLTTAGGNLTAKTGGLAQSVVLFEEYAKSDDTGGAAATQGKDVNKTVCSNYSCTTYHEAGSGYKFSDPSSFSPGIGLAGFGSDITSAIAGIAGQVYNYEQTSNSAFYDPIEFMVHLGANCLAAAGEIWTDGATIIGVAAGFAGVCQAVNPGAAVMQSLMSWLSPLYIMTASGLFVAGFMLTFYAPLYPYLLFLFGGLSWILYVLEAMVAAPLVCFGMTHPEGQELLGRAEQSLMLLLGVFMRPVLMVIGFLGGMVLSYIAFGIVNYGFSHVLRSVFNNFVTPDGTTLHTDPTTNVSVLNSVYGIVTNSNTMASSQGTDFTGHHITDFLLIPLLLIFYGLIAVEVVNQSFSLIHVLPDMVLRWIGGPVQQDRTEAMLNKLQSSLSGAAKQVGEIGGSATVNSGAVSGTASGGTSGVGIGVAQTLAK
jgi:defect in organelle trafficking protein DotA